MPTKQKSCSPTSPERLARRLSHLATMLGDLLLAGMYARAHVVPASTPVRRAR